MAQQAHTAEPLDDSAENTLPSLRYVARQPILDLRNRLHGYELLFRDAPENFLPASPDQATRTLLDDTVLCGLEAFTAGQPAFIRVTAEALHERLTEVLPASMTVLELINVVDPSPEIVTNCEILKASGFRLALGSYCWEPGFEPLLKLADYIKVDFSLLCGASRRYVQAHIGTNRAVALIADKVESQRDFEHACTEGFRLFQGFYFARPELMSRRTVPSNRMAQISILELLHTEPLDMLKAAEMVKRDAALTYRLLRLVNSPMCAIRQEVRSIESALMVVGEEVFRKLATLAITSELNGSQNPELLRMAFVRGRFCELTAPQLHQSPSEQYLLGLLSLLPAMMRMPMEDLVPVMPLRLEIREALLGALTPERGLLDWIESHERGAWPACDAIAQAHHLKKTALAKAYTQSVTWAEDALFAVCCI